MARRPYIAGCSTGQFARATQVLITHEPHPGPGAARGGGPRAWECGLPARGKLAKAALPAPSAGKDARNPGKTTLLASPPRRDELGTYSGASLAKYPRSALKETLSGHCLRHLTAGHVEQPTA